MFWQRLVELCTQNGISPSKLAETLGLSNATPVRWKRGSIPQARILYWIAEYFGVTTSYLLGETDIKCPADTNTDNLSDLYKRIEELCRSNDMTITKMCKECGISRASITDLKMGRHNSLSADALSAISHYFGVSVDVLLGKEKTADPSGAGVSEVKRKAIEMIKQMSDEECEKLVQFLEMAKK